MAGSLPGHDVIMKESKEQSPRVDVRHGCPRLLRRLGAAAVEKFNRNSVGRFDEGHAAVARRTVDGDAPLHQLLADGVDIFDLEGEMAEIAPAGVDFGIPIISELD